MVRLLLKSGAQLEINNKVILGSSTVLEDGSILLLMIMCLKQEGRTPLMLASWRGQVETVIELLRGGAQANTQDRVCTDQVCDCVHVC